MTRRIFWVLFMAFLLFAQLGFAQSLVIDNNARVGLERITPNLIESHIELLSDDLFEGRAPATRGDRLAMQYIAAQFLRIGLQPGYTGSFFQPVPIVGMTGDASMMLRASRNDAVIEFKFYDEFVGYSGIQEPIVSLDAEVVFVGYGIVAPEQKWNDYKDFDVRGKVLLMMNNDPAGDDPNFFGGKARLYYGRWTYKYEIAAAKGAAGAIIIHTPESAGYGWNVVQSSWSRERFSLADSPEAGLPIKAWLTEQSTKRLLQLSGHDLAALQQMAQRRDFTPVPLGVRISTTIQSEIRHLETANVLGLLRGSDSTLREEAVIFTAHHDHLGIGKTVNGDSVYNGALDNASGVGALLAVAEAFAALPERPKRTLLFMTVGAEEQGLLGSQYYSEHPTIPPGRIAANVNIDVLNVFGLTKDIIMIGKGRSTIDQIVEKAAKLLNLVVKPDQFPEQGFFYRSDQLNFARIGVPTAYFDQGLDFVGKPVGYGRQLVETYIEKNYHQPSDEVQPDWDYRGAEQQTDFNFLIGYFTANQQEMPRWNPGDEFEAARNKALRETK
ncbi:MAG: M28 family peptidase [Bacteroidota bacterium]